MLIRTPAPRIGANGSRLLRPPVHIVAGRIRPRHRGMPGDRGSTVVRGQSLPRWLQHVRSRTV